MIAILRQILIGMAVLAVAFYVWVTYVPAAGAFLDRVGVLALLGIEADQSGPQGGSQQERQNPKQELVVVSPVEARTLTDRVSAIGDGRANKSVTVRSEAVGRITMIAPESGSRVEEGAVLVRLDDEAETIALEKARILLENAQDEERRVARLGTSGAVTEVRLRETELELRTAELALRQAQFDFSQRSVIAPISGWVGIIDNEVGDRISAQETLFIITDRSQILIDFRVPERVIGKMFVGMPIKIMPLGLRDLVLDGEISAIDTIVDRTSRTLRVQGRVDNSEDQLRVGMAFSVSLSFPGETLMSIDPLALQWSGDGSFVWRVRDGRVDSGSCPHPKAGQRNRAGRRFSRTRRSGGDGRGPEPASRHRGDRRRRGHGAASSPAFGETVRRGLP